MTDEGYPRTPRNSINRLRNRAKYDFATVHGIVNSTNVVHVSFAPVSNDPFPVVLPMIGQMGSFNIPEAGLNQPLDLFLHGSISSRMMKLSQEAVSRGDEGLAVCIAATKVDGYVLALTPFHHSYNFRSAVLHGHAQVVEDLDKKMYALELITNKVVPGRWQNTRTPPSKAELRSTNILRVRVFAGSAKLRWGGPNGDRGDLKDEEVLNKYWWGVIPMWEMFGSPIPSTMNKAPLPDHVIEFVEKTNEENRLVALESSKEQK